MGRDASSGVLLSDPAVSREHCMLRCEDNKVIVYDVGSSTGSPTGGTVTVLHAEVGNYYDSIPDYPNLPWVESWQLEAEVTGAFGNDHVEGAIRGAVEVFVYEDTLYLYVKDLVGVRVFTSQDGLNWDNPDGSGPHVVLSGPEGNAVIYSHPYVATAPDGTMQMFLQSRDMTADKAQFHISRASSTDGMSFSEPSSFLKCEEVLADYGCSSCAHGRITELADRGYAIAFSVSCQKENFPKDLAKTFVPGMMMAYSDDLVNWEIDPLAFFPACHDPTFDTSRGEVFLYCASEVDTLPVGVGIDLKHAQLLRYDSPDGRSWTPDAPAGMVRFFDADGEQMHRDTWSMADLDTHLFSDGTLRLYVPAGGEGYPTVYAFQLME